MRVRDAKAGDQFTLFSLVISHQLNPLDVRWSNFIVAVDENERIIGCAQLKRIGSVQEIASIIVVQAHRGKGIPDRLIETLLERAQRPLWLACESPLTSFYEKFGFEEVLVSSQLPPYFQSAYWSSRTLFSMVFSFRNTYLAFMVLRT